MMLPACVGVAVLVSLGGCFGGGGGKSGEVGQCAKDASGSDDITIVDCTSPDAKYRIVGVEERVSSGTPGLSCAKYKDATKNLWFGKSGELGRAVCLQQLK